MSTEEKSMYLANFNITFGTKDEPLLNWLDDFVMPALKANRKRILNKKTKVMFENVYIDENIDGELVLRGVIIKDTVLDIYNQYKEGEGLVDVEDHPKSAPYSTFIVFLKNHRMVLVRNQSGSPDLRLFISTIRDFLISYRSKENKLRREKQIELLPVPIIGIKGIQNTTTVSEFLKQVKRVKSVSLILKPRNNEWGGLDGLIDQLDKKVLKYSNSKCIKLVINSPESINGISEIINNTEGMVETEIEFEYPDNEINDEGKAKKGGFGKIRDDEISQRVEIQIHNELRDNFAEVYSYCKQIESLGVQTSNIVDYNAYVQKRKKKHEREEK